MASKFPKQRTRLVKVVRILSGFLDGKEIQTGTSEYSLRSTGSELYIHDECIAIWQKDRILLEKSKGTRSTEHCKSILRLLALQRGVPNYDI